MSDSASRALAGGDPRTVANRQAHPVYDSQDQRTIGERGPATLVGGGPHVTGRLTRARTYDYMQRVAVAGDRAEA